VIRPIFFLNTRSTGTIRQQHLPYSRLRCICPYLGSSRKSLKRPVWRVEECRILIMNVERKKMFWRSACNIIGFNIQYCAYWKRVVGMKDQHLKSILVRDCWDTQIRSQEHYIRKIEYVRMILFDENSLTISTNGLIKAILASCLGLLKIKKGTCPRGPGRSMKTISPRACIPWSARVPAGKKN